VAVTVLIVKKNKREELMQDVFCFSIMCDRCYSWLQKKTGTVRIKLTHFNQFFSVKLSYER
jgi:hypothetical protein